MKITSPGSATLRGSNPPAAAAVAAEHPVAIAGRLLVRYGLVVVIAWIGALKYGTYEAAAIQPLIALRPAWPRVSAAGSAFGVLLFLSTLSFLFSTPGVTAASAGGFPVLSVLPGQFLLKDLVLIGAALWTLGDSLGAARAQARPAR